MSESPQDETREAPNGAVDPEQLVQELRRQIAAVREQMEEHRETMLAAGLTGVAPREKPSWAPREEHDDNRLLSARLSS